jgi:hypothetical protein
MKFQLTQHGWPIGQWLIPAGEIIDLDKSPEQMTGFERLAVGKTPPMNAIALDDDCADAMAKA